MGNIREIGFLTCFRQRNTFFTPKAYHKSIHIGLEEGTKLNVITSANFPFF